MKRRDVLRSALVGTGVAFGSTAHTHGAQHIAPAAASAAAAANEAWTPLLFDAHQNETVIALSELIIPATDTPGAAAANVNRHIDLVLNDGPAEPRNNFLQGLAWLDGHSIEKHGAPFVRCSPAQQTAMLESFQDPDDQELDPGAEFFQALKELTVEGYYTSKIGIDELNKGGRVPDTYACTHEEHA